MLHGDTIVTTYMAADVESVITSDTSKPALCGSSTTCWVGEETFTSVTLPTTTSGNFTTNFESGSDLYYSTGAPTATITGTYQLGSSDTGSPLTDHAADQYGGAGGTGNYPELLDTATSAESYTLTLTDTGLLGVNYFGLWVSALDAGNQIQFYDGTTLVYTLSPAAIEAAVGGCTVAGGYCGNPNTGTFHNQNPDQQYVFLNFYDVTGYFTSITFTETLAAPSSGFETDNQTVAYISSIVPIGTVFTPEPGSFVLLSLGTLALIGLRRRSARRCCIWLRLPIHKECRMQRLPERSDC
ncbi:MAG: PEP-CTERM sorting domain-containing protein [Bryobacteraceae bacterium]